MSRASAVVALAKRTDLSEAETGRLDVLLDRHLSVTSPVQLAAFLYEKPGATGRWSSRIPSPCGFSKRFQREGRSLTDRTTQGVEALLSLWRETMGWRCEFGAGYGAGSPQCGNRNSSSRKTCEKCKAPRGPEKLTPDPRLSATLRLLWLHALRDRVASKVDRDGRIRCSVNLAGDADFSHHAYASNCDTGLPFSQVPDAMRHLFTASEGHTLGLIRWVEPRLSIAAAEMATLGDPRLLDDLRGGMVDEHGMLWLTLLGEQPTYVSAAICRETYAATGTPLYVEPAAIRTFQDAAHNRYRGIRQRMEWLRGRLSRDGHLTAPGGARRVFFGRRTDHSTERDLFGFTPRAGTTYAVEEAWRLCPEIIRVLFAGDDYLLTEAPSLGCYTTRAHSTQLTVGTHSLTLPVVVSFGRNWAEVAG